MQPDADASAVALGEDALQAVPRDTPKLFAFGFGVTFFASMVGPFLADKGLTLTQFGVLALISLCVLPVEGLAFFLFATMDGPPPLPMFVGIVALLGFGTSIYTFVVNNSRFRWPSREQAATDFSMHSSIWNFGVWAAGSLSGFTVAGIGWAGFFPLAAGIATVFALCYVLMYDRVEALCQARERRELVG